MGNVYRKLTSCIFGGISVRVLIFGLDGSGKTTMLYRLKLDEEIQAIPTLGFNVETVTHKNFDITLWDIGGRDGTRSLIKYKLLKWHFTKIIQTDII